MHGQARHSKPTCTAYGVQDGAASMLQPWRSWRSLQKIAAHFGRISAPSDLMFSAVPHLSTANPAHCCGLTTFHLAAKKWRSKAIRTPHGTMFPPKWLCSSPGIRHCSAHAAQTVTEPAAQAQNGHGLSPEQAAAVFAGDGHLM